MNDNLYTVKKRKRTGFFSMAREHFHEDYEIYYLLSGERYFFINNKTYYLKQGDIAFIAKDDLHKSLDAGAVDHERIVVLFKPRFLQQLVSPADQEQLLTPFHQATRTTHLNIHEQQHLESLLFQLLKENHANEICAELLFRSVFLQFLIYLRRIVPTDQEAFEYESPIHQKISEISDYLNDHYKDSLSLTTVANTFYLNASYLSRTFKQITGFSFIEYINHLRIKEAQKLLRETKWKVTDIADEVGFESLVHFGRVFKRISQLSPLEFRKKTKL